MYLCVHIKQTRAVSLHLISIHFSHIGDSYINSITSLLLAQSNLLPALLKIHFVIRICQIRQETLTASHQKLYSLRWWAFSCQDLQVQADSIREIYIPGIRNIPKALKSFYMLK